MEDFIYESKSLSNEICDEIINLFETTSINKKFIPINIDCKTESIWYATKNILIEELSKHLQDYCSGFFCRKKTIHTIYIEKHSNDKKINFFKNENWKIDFHIENKQKKISIINFVWFLNDVEEGGQIKIFEYKNIKPEKGKLVFFPTEWFFPYRDIQPISNDKYIITGSIYIDF